ncbi:Os12g0144100, partial [Oryza sativa Japonica Group]
RSVGPWGSSSGGDTTTIQLGLSEYVMEVSGTYGAYNSNVVVMSLRVATNLRAYGPFGRAEGTSFTASGRVVGFFGRSGELLDSIGVYTA